MSSHRVEFAYGVPGEVVTARVSNPLEIAAATRKPRLVVLVRRESSRWFVMGLTTRATYVGGQPRTPVPNPAGVGLRGTGYLWGDRLTAVCSMDIDAHVGWCDADLAATIIVQAGLSAADAAALIRSVSNDGRAA